MKTFFLLLFFSKNTLLTDIPVTIKDTPLIINVGKPLSAITNGASLLIDVSSMMGNIEQKSISQLREQINNIFGDHNISAELIGKSNKITLKYSGNSMINNNQILLVLHSNKKLSELGKWNQVVISSSNILTDVNIYWKNYSK